MPTTKDVVLVHGLWVTTASWDPFRAAFESAGYRVHTPTWDVLKGRTAAELNTTPPAGLGPLSVGSIVDGLAADIAALPAPPLLVGHSFGGLFVQMLLDRGLGRAAAAINPAPIAGLIPGLTTLSAALPPILRPGGWARPYALSRERFAQRYANSAPRAVQDDAYDRYVIPTSGKVFYQAAFWAGTAVNPHRRTAPLLLTESDADRLITPYLSRAAYNMQRRSIARTDFISFPGRSHLLIAEPGWEEIAQAVMTWDRTL